MCGLVGSAGPEASRYDLAESADRLQHRGPDEDGRWIAPGERAQLAHKRLSIVGVDDGCQPIQNEDKMLTAVVNGEFYRYDRWRALLERKGHAFRTESDSELILHLYEEYGNDAWSKLRGEYAFLLYDRYQGTLKAVRDRFGVKPLYYATDGETTYFASEAKALFELPCFEADWDHETMHFVTSLQYRPPGRTLFEGIKQLKPGTSMTVRTDGTTETHRYWDLDYPKSPTFSGSIDEAVQRVRALLRESVEERLQGDVPVVCQLSGGLDSSAVLGIAADLLGDPPDSFAVSFEAEPYDELKRAREQAQRVGSTLHAVSVDQQTMLDSMGDAVEYAEGLAINGHLAAKFQLSKAIHECGYKVVLTGEGADEVFAGYPHLRDDLIRLDESELSRDDLKATNEASEGIQLPSGEQLPLDAVEETLGFVPSYLRAKASMGRRLHQMRGRAFAEKMAKRDAYAELMDRFEIDQLTDRHPVNQSLYLWTKLTLANYILNTLGDGTEMAHSVEGRVPFLSHRLFEFVRTLPMDMKINSDGVEKHVLRKAVRPYVTDSIYERQKHPFMAPPTLHFDRDATRDHLRDIVRSRSFQALPFFDAKRALDKLDDLTDATRRERTAWEPVFMLMLTGYHVQKRFIEGA